MKYWYTWKILKALILFVFMIEMVGLVGILSVLYWVQDKILVWKIKVMSYDPEQPKPTELLLFW